MFESLFQTQINQVFYKFVIQVSKETNIQDLGVIMSKKVGDVQPKHLIFAEIWRSQLGRVLDKHDYVTELSRRDHVFCYHLPPMEEVRHVLILFVHDHVDFSSLNSLRKRN